MVYQVSRTENEGCHGSTSTQRSGNLQPFLIAVPFCMESRVACQVHSPSYQLTEASQVLTASSIRSEQNRFRAINNLFGKLFRTYYTAMEMVIKPYLSVTYPE